MLPGPYFDHPALRKIVVVRALPGLGDFLCTVPALRALRSASPGAHVTLVGTPSVQPLVERFSYLVDDLLEFPGYPGVPERAFHAERFLAFLREAHSRRFDLAIQMHGSGLATNPFTLLLGAKHNAGLYPAGQYCPDLSTFLPWEEQESEIRRYTALMEHLGFPSMGEDLEFPLCEEDFARLSQIKEAATLKPGLYACVHPGAADPLRRWSPENFAAVADRLAAEGLQIVLTGTAQERRLTAAVALQMKAPAVDLAGQTDLGSLAALLSRARLLVCNDTGVSHLAAALDVPSVVVFTATDPARWAPLNASLHRVVLPENGREQSLFHAYELLNNPSYPGTWS